MSTLHWVCFLSWCTYVVLAVADTTTYFVSQTKAQQSKPNQTEPNKITGTEQTQTQPNIIQNQTQSKPIQTNQLACQLTNQPSNQPKTNNKSMCTHWKWIVFVIYAY